MPEYPAKHGDQHVSDGPDPIPLTSAIEFVIDGGGSVISTGLKGFLEVPWKCTIKAARIVSDPDGDIVVDIWRDTFSGFPPASGDSITGSNPPELGGSDHAEDETLSGWDVDLLAGDWLAYNVDSVSDCVVVTVSLTVTRN